MKMHELLIPVGNYEKAIYAFEYGADAIYLGAKAFSLRARSSNFDFKEIKKITSLAHKLNKKVYLVANIICRNAHIDAFEPFFKEIKKYNIDAYIVADPFIFSAIRKMDKKAEIHVSTQQSVTNSKSALFWKRNGATRVVLGREVSYDELKLLTNELKGKIELEYFIHGAVCIAYSGRCMMSNNFSMRDANVGGCAQSCRWKYKILNFKGISKLFTMSAKDMALVNDFEKLLNLPIASFKVEGRMKSIHYLATVSSSYRKIIDEYNANKKITIEPILTNLKKTENRISSNAFFDGNPNFDKMLYHDEDDTKVNQIFVFTILEKMSKFEYKIISRNAFSIKDKIEILFLDLNKNIICNIKKISTLSGENLEFVNVPMREYLITLDKEIIGFKNKIARIYK